MLQRAARLNETVRPDLVRPAAMFPPYTRYPAAFMLITMIIGGSLACGGPCGAANAPAQAGMIRRSAAPCLRLRGGFFKLPGSNENSQKKSLGSGETATAADFEDAEKDAQAEKDAAKAATSPATGTGQDAAAAAPQLTVQQHMAEYALAGSLDGLRTGLGQRLADLKY